MRTPKLILSAFIILLTFSAQQTRITFAEEIQIIQEPESANQWGFSDVSLQNPFYKAIQYLKNRGIVAGYEDGTYRPDQKITRGEFVRIVMGIAGYEEKNNCFKDVKKEWFAPYACSAKEKGIVSGYSGQYFEPNKNISFVEAAKIIATALKLDLKEEGEDWYEKYVDALGTEYAIPITVMFFNQEINRGEMAEMIWRIEDKEAAFGVISDTYASIKFKEDYSYMDPKQAPNEKMFDLMEVAISDSEIPAGIDMKTAKEIKIRASVYNAIFKNIPLENKVYVGVHKGFIYYFRPETNRFLMSKMNSEGIEFVGGAPFLGFSTTEYANMVFMRNVDGIYQFIDDIVNPRAIKQKDLDVDTFELVYSYGNGEYLIFKDKKYVYEAKDGKLTKLPELDAKSAIVYMPPKSFNEYLKDKNGVYDYDYENQKLIKVKESDLL